jgi:hypothetical protein
MARCGRNRESRGASNGPGEPTERRPILAAAPGMSARGAAVKLDKRGLPMRVGRKYKECGGAIADRIFQ